MSSKSLGVVNFSSEPLSVEIREVERPIAGDDDVILQVEAVSVCGSDLHQWHGTNSWPVNYPVVLGHEFGGQIVELGKNVADKGFWKVGDRAVSETAAVVDMSTPMSRIGKYNLDPDRKGFGYGVNGGMTRYAKVPSRCLHRIPDTVSFEHAALTEPCAVAFSAVIAPGNIKPGDRIVVLGPGPIGTLCAAMARLAGAEVAVVGLPDDERGMIVTAYVVLRPEFIASDVMAKELQDHVKSQIAPYKYPRSIHFVDSLPKTTTGKLQRFRLKS